jgi:hypothetical protein
VFCTLKELQDLFVDACIRDAAGNLMFMSVYGRDGAVQQLLAAIQLGSAEGGLRYLTLVDPQTRRDVLPVSIGDRDRLTKFTGRLPKENLFGNLVHLWLYDPEIMKPSRGTGSAWLLVDQCSDPAGLQLEHRRDRVWALYQELSKVPLLPHWRDPILDATENYVADLSEPPFPAFGRIRAWKITMPTDFPELVSRLVRERIVTVDGQSLRAVRAAA